MANVIKAGRRSETATYQPVTDSPESERARKSRDFLMQRPMQAQPDRSVAAVAIRHAQSRHDRRVLLITYCKERIRGGKTYTTTGAERQCKNADFFRRTAPGTGGHV